MWSHTVPVFPAIHPPRLSFFASSLPGAFDLCRLIEEKLQLERELAERERMAVLGQMAASISHNLKNPWDQSNNSAGATGKPGNAGVTEDRDPNGLRRDIAAFEQVGTAAAIQPANGLGRCERSVRRGSSGERGERSDAARGGAEGIELAVSAECGLKVRAAGKP